ncbi:hypothetical protein [Nodularia spumigena]|jgi:hypothetical protein|uniref:hypothetical protein n=1 Tax=Nodularia spumigena TaxID=70799 RepID=UPI002B20C696|nr:hypothetical protein [Nodularia spumigena]MEA5527782.1 hypothetical protein [Nodularia spumigena UHCC 0143]
MSRWQSAGEELAKLLQGVTDEATIKELAQSTVESIREAYPDNINSRKKPMADVRKAFRAVFPATKKQEHKGQYFTNSGKGNVPRYEHLFFQFFTLTTDEYDAVGDDARQQWKEQQQVETPAPTPTPAPAEVAPAEVAPAESIPAESIPAPVATAKIMNISQLELDADTQKMVEDAIAHSGLSLAEFVRKSCQTYSAIVVGKAKMSNDDLTTVSTQDLLTNRVYKTHPNRAEELTRRAIYALETHNNNCTEKSQKWHINQTAIQSLTGSKPATVKEILKGCQQRLDDHNAKHDLNPYDNRKPGQKLTEVIDLAALVPDGVDVD